MRLPGINRLRRAFSSLLGGRGAVIFMYHRVDEVGADPWRLTVHPRHFAEHLAFLRRTALPVTLRQLVSGEKEWTERRPLVALTFDDGYADNLHTALPLLREYDIPATIFVTASAVGCGREFWWDELEGLLLEPGRLPDRLQATINGHVYEWTFGHDGIYSSESWRRHRRWRVWHKAPTRRHSAYVEIWRLLRTLPDMMRRHVLDGFARQAGRTPPKRAGYLPLGESELRLLAKDDLIEIGSHSMSHADLSTLSPEAQWDEIARSKAWLEVSLGNPVLSFAYPYGRSSPAVVSVVRRAGYKRACTTEARRVGLAPDPFQLPRIAVGDWNIEKLSRRMARRSL